MASSFFPEPAPEPEFESEDRTPPPWFGPHPDEYPARVLVREFLFRGDGTSVSVSHVDVHSTGLSIAVEWALRRRSETRAQFQQSAQRAFNDPAAEPSQRRRFGVSLADGSVATTVDRALADLFRREPAGPVLLEREQGGGGGDGRWEGRSELWLWPLPPAGPIELVGEWGDRDMPESRIVLDGADLVSRVGDIRSIWP